MKAPRVSSSLPELILNLFLGTGWRWRVSITRRSLYPQERTLRYPFNRRQKKPRTDVDGFWRRRKSLAPRRESNIRPSSLWPSQCILHWNSSFWIEESFVTVVNCEMETVLEIQIWIFAELEAKVLCLSSGLKPGPPHHESRSLQAGVRTQKSWRKGLLCTWGGKGGISVVGTASPLPPYKWLTPSFLLEDLTGQKLTNEPLTAIFSRCFSALLIRSKRHDEGGRNRTTRWFTNQATNRVSPYKQPCTVARILFTRKSTDVRVLEWTPTHTSTPSPPTPTPEL